MQQWIEKWEREQGELLPGAAPWWSRLSDNERQEWARWRAEFTKHRQLAKQAERHYNRIRQRGSIRAMRANRERF